MSPSSTLHGFSSRCDTLMACVIECSISRMCTGKWCGTASKALKSSASYATCAGQKATALLARQAKDAQHGASQAPATHNCLGHLTYWAAIKQEL